jgi:hypothetical protein
MKTCSTCGEPITEEFDLDAFLDWWEKLIDDPATPLPNVALAHRCEPKERMPVAPLQVKNALARRQDMKDRLARFKAHIRDGCRDYKIRVKYRFNCGSAAFGGWRICIPPIVDDVAYAVALHELGHCFNRLREGYATHTLEHEAAAWVWAKDNALEWTEPMEAKMRRCLGSYVEWVQARTCDRTSEDYGLSLIMLAAGQVNRFLAERQAVARRKLLETHRHGCPHCEERFRSAAALSVHRKEKHEAGGRSADIAGNLPEKPDTRKTMEDQ